MIKHIIAFVLDRIPDTDEARVREQLNRAGFEDIDMAGIRCNHALVRAQGCGNHRQIGLCATHQKMHCHIGRIAFLTN